MGIKHLWTVLSPFCDKKPLYELQGKTVAVDLSCWICEAQNIAEYQVQPRMYLRNLYFRTSYLLLMDVNPVFVLEGQAPELKYDTISARNALQFKGARPKTDNIKAGKGRSRFNFVLKQCEDMLRYMGLACIKGNGEAESLCATLNEDGLVDGCISQDSDCFAYGAQVVYRNFSISTQGTQSASGGAVDVYDIDKAYKGLSKAERNFGRNKIIAMALLLGSDYSDGVHGIGKESALKFFEALPDDEILDRIRAWRTENKLYDDYEKQINDKNICTLCGHTGRVQLHVSKGCASCEMDKGCITTKYKYERLAIRNELIMRSKAIQDPNFPDEFLITEFLTRKDNVKRLDLTWKQPNLVGFVKFTQKFLEWDEIYSIGKILPVLTRWQCTHPNFLDNESNLKGYLIPQRIKKVRNPKGVASYEIIWSDPKGFFKGLISDDQYVNKNIDPEKFWSTIEPQSLVELAYPDLVEAFKQSKIKPKKTTSKKTTKTLQNVIEPTNSLGIVSSSEPVEKKTRKPKTLKKTIGSIDTSIEKISEDLLDFSFSPVAKKTKKSDTPEKDWSKIAKVNKITTLDELDNYLTYLEGFAKVKPPYEKRLQAGRAHLHASAKKESSGQDKLLKQAVKNSYNQHESNKKPRAAENGILKGVPHDFSSNGNNDSQKLESPKKLTPLNFNETPQMSTPIKPNKPDNNMSFDPNISSFGDENDSDLSNIIDAIVSRKFLPFDIDTLTKKCIENDGVIEELKHVQPEPICLSSSFFLNEEDGGQEDAFEKTFNELVCISSDDEEIDIDKENIDVSSENSPIHDSLDSFCDKEYVPLSERVKSKF